QVVVQTLGVLPTQVHPGSTAQALLQPSPLITSPSSQASAPARMPSPQNVVHTLGVLPTQLHPASTAPALLQPSPPIRSPSSHASPPVRAPSPQTATFQSRAAVA